MSLTQSLVRFVVKLINPRDKRPDVIQARESIKGLTIKELCDRFKIEANPTVRAEIMIALEREDPVAFWKWIEAPKSMASNLSFFFLQK